jgi:hypothetical protein
LAHELTSQPVSLLRFCCDSGSNLLDSIQVFVQQYASSRFRPTIAEKVVVASYELLANALDYGSVSADVVYELSASRDRILVRVENQTIPTRAAMLREQLARVRADPEQAFMEEMGKSVAIARRPSLGLARIAFEVKMQLELQQKDQRVIMIASTST